MEQQSDPATRQQYEQFREFTRQVEQEHATAEPLLTQVFSSPFFKAEEAKRQEEQRRENARTEFLLKKKKTNLVDEMHI